MAPKYIAHLLNIKKKGNYSLRPNDSVMLEYPKGKFLRSFGDRSFAMAPPKLWNKLPEDIRNILQITFLKPQLKVIFFN